MTVVFAMVESDDSILLGADTLRLDDTGVKSTFHKLRHIIDAPVAWACSGNGDLGNVFSRWVLAYSWPPESWDRFESDLRARLAELNGQQREYTRLSGAEWEKNYGISCLLVAFVDGEFHIDGYDEDGLKASYLSDGFGAIGSGQSHAILAYRTMEKINLPNPAMKFGHILEIAVQYAPDCSTPIDIVRIDRVKVKQISLGDIYGQEGQSPNQPEAANEEGIRGSD